MGVTGIEENDKTGNESAHIDSGEMAAGRPGEAAGRAEGTDAPGDIAWSPEKKPAEKPESRADKTLLELSAGIIAWGAVCQLTVVWFVSDKGGYSIGLWLGTLLAAAAGVHMWWALDRALDFGQDTAVKLMTKYNIIRYVAIVAVMGLIMVSGFANPLAAFLGLMGLKVAAYLQPFTHKVLGYINN